MTPAEVRAAERAAWLVQVGVVSKSSADGHGDALEGRSLPDEPRYDLAVRRMWPFGFRSVPPAGVEAVAVFPNGAPNAGVLVGAESSRYGPSDLEAGEGALYCVKTGALVKLNKDGKVTLTSTSGQPVEVSAGAAVVVTAAAGSSVTINAGAGANVAVNAGVAGAVVVNGGARNVAADGDMAGPYAVSALAAVPAHRTV